MSSSAAIGMCIIPWEKSLLHPSPHDYPIRGYEGVCELMLIPGNVYAKKICIIRCHITPGRMFTDLGVMLVILLNL